MFFKTKFEIYSNKIPINFIKNYFTIYPKNLPNYFKKIPRVCPFDFESRKNIRTCSGFINYFRNVIVFNSPFDFIIDIKENEIKCKFGDGSFNDDRMIALHFPEQFLQYTNNDKYSSILKITFGISIKSDYPVFLNNSWWSLNSFEIIPGMINCKTPLDLNFFIPIKKNEKQIIIRQNTPLAIISVETDKKIKILFKDKKINSRDFNGLEYIMSNLKDKILPNKFSF
jgi:hypothetical protein